MIDKGVSVARLNFSHGNHEEHRHQMDGVLEVLKTNPLQHASILLDTKGPEIRTGNMENDKPIDLKKGQLLEISRFFYNTATDYDFTGNNKKISCSYLDLPKSAEIGRPVLFADGSISSVVKQIRGNTVTVEIQNDGKLGNKKNMCLPGVVINLPTITKYD